MKSTHEVYVSTGLPYRASGEDGMNDIEATVSAQARPLIIGEGDGFGVRTTQVVHAAVFKFWDAEAGATRELVVSAKDIRALAAVL